MYGALLEVNSTKPTPVQLQNGLDPTNFKLPASRFVSQEIVIPANYPKGQYKSYIFEFKDLNDNTQYDVYFIAENKLPVNPDLMRTTQMVKKTITTDKEVYRVPWDYGQLLRF